MKKYLIFHKASFFALFFLFSWWFTFLPWKSTTVKPLDIQTLDYEKKEIPQFSLCTHKELQEVFDGDNTLALRLMTKWQMQQVDLLEIIFKKNRAGFQASSLPLYTFERLQRVQEALDLPTKPIPSVCIFPQTYASASMSLALLSEKEIASSIHSFPSGMRHMPLLYPSNKLALQKEDCEKMSRLDFLTRPVDFALMSSYSSRKRGLLLQQMKVPCFQVPVCENLLELCQSMQSIAKLLGKEQRAWILMEFLQALSMQMRLQNLAFMKDRQPIKIACFSLFQDLQLLGEKTLTVNFLKNMGYACFSAKNSSLPLKLRPSQLCHMDVDMLFISSLNPKEQSLERLISRYPLLAMSKAYRQGKIYFISMQRQSTMSHCIAFHYLELFQLIQYGVCLLG